MHTDARQSRLRHCVLELILAPVTDTVRSTACDSRSMSLLTQALEEIDYWINNSQSWHANHIRTTSVYSNRPGLEREIIDLYSEEFKFQFSEEIYELYQWHDGGMLIGDMSNPISFSTLDNSLSYCIREHFPYRPYLPLFIGDESYFTVFEASDLQEKSPVFFFNGLILPEDTKPSWGSFDSKSYAPSITSLMLAIAECAKVHDGISSEYMFMDTESKYIYPDPMKRISILSPIFEKYGVTGDYCGLWR